MKVLMQKTLQSHLLRVDELTSVLIEIEAVLNSRPLVSVESTNIEEMVLTPGHFLIGHPLVAPPTATANSQSISTLRRWQLVQRLSQALWQQWKSANLQTIQQRHVCNKKPRDFRVGDVTFLREDALSYRQWPLARITQTCPRDDGITRVV